MFRQRSVSFKKQKKIRKAFKKNNKKLSFKINKDKIKIKKLKGR